jgi:hypothetical protein
MKDARIRVRFFCPALAAPNIAQFSINQDRVHQVAHRGDHAWIF